MPAQSAPDAWRFKLRPGIKFSNGEPLNAEAVVYSIKRIIDPKYNSQQISYYSAITDAKKVDDLTVDVITKGPDPILPARMYWMKVVPPIASTKPDFISNPVGTGPYKLLNWSRGSSIKLIKNDAYWGSASSMNSVSYRFIGESAASRGLWRGVRPHQPAAGSRTGVSRLRSSSALNSRDGALGPCRRPRTEVRQALVLPSTRKVSRPDPGTTPSSGTAAGAVPSFSIRKPSLSTIRTEPRP